MKIKFKIHIITLIFTFICILTGQFKLFLAFMSIILFHELGHVFGAYLVHACIDKIILLPFGGLTILKYNLNIKLLHEFIIVIMGPLFQLILFILLYKYDIYYFKEINIFLFMFNFMPIIPLDGYRLLNIFLCILFPFKLSLYISNIISFITLIIGVILLFFYNNLAFIFILFFLFYKSIEQYKVIKYIYNKFIFERYNNKYGFKKYKKIYNIDNMYRDYNHLIYFNNRFYTEKETFNRIFKQVKY